MFNLLRKIHMYIGLLSWSIILVMGIAGLDAVLSSAFKITGTSARTRLVDFAPPPNLTDDQLAQAVLRKVRIPVTPPTAYYNLRRDESNNVCFQLWTLSRGDIKVTVLEAARRVEIAEENPNLGLYLNNLHSVTMGGPPKADWRIRWWSYYTELGIWALLALTASGVWQWLASRPRHRWAQITLLLAGVTFLVLYVVTR